ncbi:uncharacterized protein At5g01610 [Cajanus cajan]|uniref:Uncharacterized protein At5g01610 family n=1 Tax=Cajanus cajan TaxID=3821 RepID=A0A151S858_CAJCA|nr:uncharacterized protein At5g01610 [Cajanus cajan]KYP51003.1 Uncharacterized protein At5g01610 family [Cajanus cajan]
MKMRCSIIFLCILAYANVTVSEKLSPYDVLEKYDLPVGLLPKGATGYELNEKNGHFTAYLNETCIFGIKSYELKYKSTIKGVISKGKLAKLKGVSVKVEVLWLKIVEVTRDGDDLQFSVGIASAGFSVDSFSESPQCGCGFVCNSFDKNGDVSSL